MKRARLIGAGLLLTGLFAMPKPAAAYAHSCGAFTIASKGGSCIYQASGPGWYQARTASGWRIWLSRDGEPFVFLFGAQQTSCESPPIAAVRDGRIPAQNGDLVRLEVVPACLQKKTPAGNIPAAVLRYEVGYIGGGDGEPPKPGGVGTPGLGGPPATGNPTNGCYANDGAGAPGATPGAISCTYTAAFIQGEYIQMTPNKITITVNGATVYSKGTASANAQSLPSRGTFATPIGATVRVVVGPDTPGGGFFGSIGFVFIGDSPVAL